MKEWWHWSQSNQAEPSSFGIVGLGRFGSAVCKELMQNGAEVLAVGVRRHLNTRVTSVSAHAVELLENDVPQSLNHDGLIWTAGTKPVLPNLTPIPPRERGLLCVCKSLVALAITRRRLV